ncbi:MAG: insulinase family protein, partial [Armatimonadetes bacterium]|nr:insulinase family protein [Armatimonadota bacterium]
MRRLHPTSVRSCSGPFFALLLALTLVGAARGAGEGPRLGEGVVKTVLPNGLTLLVKPTRHAPVGAVVTWVKAGYFDEPDRVAGMAHLFEHMFFNGSKKYPTSQAIQIAIRGIGGLSNAGTIYDHTTYYILMPKQAVTTAMEIQADAVANPLFDERELKREAEVVIEESNRKYDNAPALAYEKMLETAFTQHRVRRWRIGSNEVLRAIRRDDLMKFFETLYRPKNIVVSVVGDVNPAEILETARRTYGQIPEGKPERDAGPKEPEQTALRTATLTGDIPQAYVTLGFPACPPDHPDQPALDVVQSVLSIGRGSRFNQSLVRSGISFAVDASNQAYGDLGFFGIQARVDPSRVAEAEEKIIQELEKLKRWPISPMELERARTQVETLRTLQTEDVLNQAQVLAEFESRGAYEEADRYYRRVTTVTAEEVQAVAKKYFPLHRLTVHRYLPRAAQAPPATAAELTERLTRAAAAATAPVEPAAPPALTQGRGLEGGSGDPVLRSKTLPNGIRLLVQERHTVPTAAVAIAFAGGKAQETAERAGITQLLFSTLSKGTPARDAATLDRVLDGLGTTLESVVADDFSMLSATVLSRNTGPLLELLTDVIRNPTFPDAEVTRAVQLQAATSRVSREDGINYPIQLVSQALYGSHPYGWRAFGREESIPGLNRSAVQEWYGRVVRPSSMWVIVSGDVQATAVEEALTRHFGSWTGAAGAALETTSPQSPRLDPDRPVEVAERRDRRQTAFAMGFPTPPFGHPDQAALDVLQGLTGGLAGRLGAELRGRQGLAYVTTSLHRPLAKGGVFLGYLAGDPSKEEQARRGMAAEFAKLTREPVSAYELQ